MDLESFLLEKMFNWLFSISLLNYNPTIFNVHIHITLYFYNL